MGFREVPMVQLAEILRLWLLGHAYRSIERLTSIHCKTVARHVGVAIKAGLRRDGGQEQPHR